MLRVDLHLFSGYAQRLQRNDLPACLVVADDHGEAGAAGIRAFHLRFETAAAAVKHDGDTALAHPAHLWWRLTIRSLLQQMQVSGDVDYMTDALYVLTGIHTVVFQRDILGYDLSRIRDGVLATLDKFLNS